TDEDEHGRHGAAEGRARRWWSPPPPIPVAPLWHPRSMGAAHDAGVRAATADRMIAGRDAKFAPSVPTAKRSLRVRLYLPRIALAVLTGLVVSSAAALGIDKEVTLPEGEVGQAYEFQFEAEEGCLPYHFHYYTGNLPPGLEIAEDGVLSGTPTSSGSFQFWI